MQINWNSVSERCPLDETAHPDNANADRIEETLLRYGFDTDNLAHLFALVSAASICGQMLVKYLKPDGGRYAPFVDATATTVTELREQWVRDLLAFAPASVISAWPVDQTLELVAGDIGCLAWEPVIKPLRALLSVDDEFARGPMANNRFRGAAKLIMGDDQRAGALVPFGAIVILVELAPEVIARIPQDVDLARCEAYFRRAAAMAARAVSDTLRMDVQWALGVG